MTTLTLLQKQTNGDFELLRRKLEAAEENLQAIRTLIDRIEIPIKHQQED
jgi:hypothetical protein